MKAIIPCPECGRPGKQSGRYHLVVGSVEITSGPRTVRLQGKNVVNAIFRCPKGHRWERPRPRQPDEGALDAALDALRSGLERQR
jgi:hypothetical protein